MAGTADATAGAGTVVTVNELVDAWDWLAGQGLVPGQVMVPVRRDGSGRLHRQVTCPGTAVALVPVRDVLETQVGHWCECGGVFVLAEHRLAGYAASVRALLERDTAPDGPLLWADAYEWLSALGMRQSGLARYDHVQDSLLPHADAVRRRLLGEARRQLDPELLRRAVTAWMVTERFDWEVDRAWLGGVRAACGVTRQSVATLPMPLPEDRQREELLERYLAETGRWTLLSRSGTLSWGHAPEVGLYLWLTDEGGQPDVHVARVPVRAAQGVLCAVKHTPYREQQRGVTPAAAVARDTHDPQVLQLAARLWCDGAGRDDLDDLLQIAERL